MPHCMIYVTLIISIYENSNEMREATSLALYNYHHMYCIENAIAKFPPLVLSLLNEFIKLAQKNPLEKQFP